MGPKVLPLPGTCCLTLITHGLCLGCFGCLQLFLAGSHNSSFLESWLHLWLHSHIFMHCHLGGYPRDPDLSLPGFRPLWPRNLCSMYRKAITQLISRSATCSTSSQIFLDFSSMACQYLYGWTQEITSLESQIVRELQSFPFIFFLTLWQVKFRQFLRWPQGPFLLSQCKLLRFF